MNNLMNPKYPEGRNLFQDKNILITAAAGSGIGFSTAKRFLEEGANIFISDVHQGRLDEAIESLRKLKMGEVQGCLCNVTSDEEIEAMFKEAIACYSSLNGVINNAGLGGESLLENMTNDAWDLVMDVTLNGAMKIMRAAIPVLKDTQGVIVNNASVLGWRAQAGQSHYAAAKAGVMALTRCVALETVDHGIRINAVAPSLDGNKEVSQFNSAQMIAEKWNISRLEMENYAYQSHQKAMSAIEKGLFKDEIVSVEGFNTDETPRAETSLEKMASLNPLIEGHDITAAISSQNADASSAILIVSEKILKEHNLTPLARIAHISVRADDPIWMLTAPMPATEYAVKKSGIQLHEIGLVEINEAFASVAMAWQKEMEYPMDQINISGGAIALGHPLGATGARLMTTMVHNMKRNNIKYGLQTMCEGGGQANVTILENCS